MRILVLCLLMLRALSCRLHVVSRHHHYSSLLEGFAGRFSNDDQAAQARLAGKPTAAEGGHELVSVSIERHPSLSNVLVATYCLGALGDKGQLPFRFRFYEFVPPPPISEEGGVVATMRLHRPLPQTDRELRENSYDVRRYLPDLMTAFEYLEHCDIQWSHVSPGPGAAEGYYHGTLVEGQCMVCSQADASVRLLIKDDLRVYRSALWICDRAYTASGKQVIGNTDGVPYKLQKHP